MFRKAKRLAGIILLGLGMFSTCLPMLSVHAQEPTPEHDTNRIEEVPKKEQELNTEDYLKKYMDKTKLNPNDEMRTVSILKVTSTLYDPAYLQGEQTLENLWRPGESKNNARALVGQFLAIAPIYTTRESKYGVAKVNLMEEEGKEVVQYEAGKATTEGIVYDDMIYDSKTGLVYIPKEYIAIGEPSDLGIQLLYSMPNPQDNLTTDVNVSLNTKSVDLSVPEEGKIVADITDDTTKIQLAQTAKDKGEIRKNTIEKVTIDGVEYDKDSDKWDYSSKTGTLTIKDRPTAIKKVDIDMENNVVKDVTSLFTFEKENVNASDNNWNDFSINNMAFTFDKKPWVGMYFELQGEDWSDKTPRHPAAETGNMSDWFVGHIYDSGQQGDERLAYGIIEYTQANKVIGNIKDPNAWGYANVPGWSGGHLTQYTVSAKMYHQQSTGADDGNNVVPPRELNLILFCSHLSVPGHGDLISATGMRYKAVLKCRILKVEGEYAWMSLCATKMGDGAKDQAGAGLFKLRWKVPYEEPQYDRMTDKATASIAINSLTNSDPKVSKVDKNTGKSIAGTKFDVMVQNYNGNANWQKYATVTTDANGYASMPTITLSRDTEAVTGTWITNADKVDPDRINMTTSEADCRNWVNEQLAKKKAELETKLRQEAKNIKVKLVESSPAGGYKIESGQNTQATGAGVTTITNTPIAKELRRTAKKVLEKEIVWDYAKEDIKTKDKLSDGLFDIYVSNMGPNFNENNPEAGKDTYTLVASNVKAVDGAIKGRVKIQSNEKTFTSDIVKYIDVAWDSLRPEDKRALKTASRSEAEGIQKAQAQANQRANEAQTKFLQATHNVKIVEKQSPEGYFIKAHKGFTINADGTGQMITANGKGVIYNSGTTVHVAKVGMDKEVVNGAKLTLLRAKDNFVYDTWVSDGTPHLVENLAPKTEYIIREVEFPEDYVKTKKNETRFTTDAKGTPVQLEIVNTKVTFSKVDATGEEVEGAHIVVKDESGKTVDEWVSTKEVHKIRNLEEGKTYTLTETVQPGGLNLANTITFTATNEDQHLTMVDTISRAVKVGADGSYVAGALMQVLDKDGNVLDEWTTREQLIDMGSKALTQAGAKYNNGRTVKVVNVTNSKYKEGENVVEVIFTNGDAEYFETDASGKETAHRVRGLDTRNTYTLHEEMAPAGFGRAEDVTFTPDPAKDVEARMVDTVTTFSKVDAGGEEIEGAKIQVIDEDGNVVDEWVSTKEPHVVQNLEQGKKYWFHEEVAPGGYVYAHDIEFTLNPVENQHYTMIDVVHGVRKVDEHGKLVKGAKLQLVDIETGKVVDEWVSGQNLIELTEEQQAKMDAGEEVTITNDTGTYTITPITEETATTEPVEQTEQAETEDKSLLESVTDLITGNEEEKVFTMKKVDPEGNYSYYEIDRDGNETVHRVSNAMATTDYKVVEVETPATYVKSQDVPLTPDAEKDAVTDVIDKQIRFSKLDVTGDEVEGAKIEVIDEKGKVVDEWISTKEVHYIENLEMGHKYTLKETITPGGYVQASAIDFEVTPDGIDAHYKMVDTIHRIIKIDPKKKTVKNAKLAVYTKDGKKIDEWTTGQHIRDLDKADVEKASRGERVVLESAYTQYTSEQLEGMYADLDKAIEKTLPEPSQEEGTTPAEPEAGKEGFTPTESEAGEEVFTADDYINKAFEYMAVTAEELESHKQAVTEMLATLTEENVEDVRTKVHEYAKTVQEDMNKKLRAEAEDLSGVYLEKNEHSSGGYTLIEIAKNGTMKYIDIDEFGDEANHRVSGIVAGETYVLKELQAPFGYINAPAMEFVADGYTDLKLTMIDQFVLERKTDVIPVNPLMVAGVAGVLLLAGGAIILVRKKRLA